MASLFVSSGFIRGSALNMGPDSIAADILAPAIVVARFASPGRIQQLAKGS